MTTILKVKNHEEFEQRLKDKDLEISKAIVDTILEHLDSKERFIPILEVELEEEGDIYDINLDNKNTAILIQTLEQNLEIFEYHEVYEQCPTILEAINYLKSK
jgi:hypothetical protein